MISRVASRRPPGVLIRTSSIAAFSLCACSIALPTISTVMGEISPSIDTATTRGAVAWARAERVKNTAHAPSLERICKLFHLEIRCPCDPLPRSVHRRDFQLIIPWRQRIQRKHSALLRNAQLHLPGLPLWSSGFAIQNSDLGARRRRIRVVNFKVKKRLLRFRELTGTGGSHLDALRHQRCLVGHQRSAWNQANIGRWVGLFALHHAVQGQFSGFPRLHIDRRLQLSKTLSAGAERQSKVILAGSDFEFLF